MCMETVFVCIQKVDVFDLKTFSKKIYLIHVTNSWVPAGSNAVS